MAPGNLVDRFVAYVAPERALRRAKARAMLGFLYGRGSGYDAGRSDSREFKGYDTRTGSGLTDVLPGLQTMRDRSRDQVRNNPIASGAVGGVVTSTVGAGLRVQPSIDRVVLGLTDEQADEWEAQAERVFRLYADGTECDLADELTFGEMQALVLRSILESGDLLRIRRFLWDRDRRAPYVGNLFASKVQLVEADRISNPDWLPDSEKIAGGVEADVLGRHVAYYVRSTHPGDSLYYHDGETWERVVVRDADTGERWARLMFEYSRVGQRRGVPYLATVIKPLLQLERFTEAELMAAVLTSMFTVFVTSDAPVAAGGPLAGVVGETASADPGELNLGHGTIVDLNPGEQVSFADPNRPNGAFDPFVMAIVRQVGIALEVPYEVLVKHFASSYSASRGAILEAWKVYRLRRKRLVSWFCQPTYEDVISEAVARGILVAPGFFEDPLVRHAWLGTVWTGDAMPQLDPSKEADAAAKRIDLGVSTIDREARELNGSTFLENHAQRTKEERMRKDAGLGSSGSTPAALAPGADPDAEDSDVEETDREDADEVGSNDDADAPPEDRLLLGAGS